MKIDENGRYVKDDGTVIDNPGDLYKTAPLGKHAQTEAEEKDKEELQEGQSSGVIQLDE